MKILITENKLSGAIYNYIEDTFDVSNIDYFHPTTWNDDEYDDEENPYIREYFYHIYEGNYDEDGVAFVYIEEEYYSDDESTNSFREKAPILIVNDYEKLTNMFGNYWIEPMKEWFKDNFDLPVKTIVPD